MSDVVAGDVKDDQPEEESDRSEVELAIAEQIALLSQATDAPTDFQPPARAFDASEISFETPSWMACLAAVQGWVRLPDLPLENPDQFLTTLTEALGFSQPDEGIDTSDGHTRLGPVGLDRLSVQLQRAVQLQEAFQADLESDGGSLASATGRWRTAWDEESDEEPGSGPVSARAQTWPINEFSGRASRGRLNLSPSYQRGDVWPTSDAQMLIESILRGIPLPSVIILKPAGGDTRYEVVDGKQRLTSILRFIGKHPRALEIVAKADKDHPGKQFPDLFQNDYPRFRKQWKNLMGEQLTATQERAYFFPFKLRSGSTALKGNLASLQGKYYTQIKQDKVQIADDEVEVQELFESVTDYKIPLIEYSKADRRQIHEVFNLYNKQGKHLNAEEIRNALYHDVAFMRALLVASGDNDDVSGVSPCLEPIWSSVSRISECLEDYGVGSARYRRTKVLSWLASMVFVDSMEGGKPKRLSTARHIDSLLHRIQEDPSDPLRDDETIRAAFTLLLNGMDAHSAISEAWDPKFLDPQNGSRKWQELQLIASVLGVTLAAAVLGDETEDRLSDRADDIRQETASGRWDRPEKTQTASQWLYIADVSLKVLEQMQVDPEDAAAVLTTRFGFCSVPTLQAVVADAQSS